jgi:REP element-mobilizing transposase RayT
MSQPVGYFLTWTTYGTWLPGDERGWVDGASHEMHFTPDPKREDQARRAMVEAVLTLTIAQRATITRTIEDHCRIRGWHLHTVNVLTNHVHLVVSLPDHPDKALREFKAWATRRLKEITPGRHRWWTEGGSKRYLWNDDDLEAVITYVRDMQGQ